LVANVSKLLFKLQGTACWRRGFIILPVVLQTYEKSLSLYIFKIRTHRALPHSFIMEAVSLGCGSFDVTEYRKIGVHYT